MNKRETVSDRKKDRETDALFFLPPIYSHVHPSAVDSDSMYRARLFLKSLNDALAPKWLG